MKKSTGVSVRFFIKRFNLDFPQAFQRRPSGLNRLSELSSKHSYVSTIALLSQIQTHFGHNEVNKEKWQHLAPNYCFLDN